MDFSSRLLTVLLLVLVHNVVVVRCFSLFDLVNAFKVVLKKFNRVFLFGGVVGGRVPNFRWLRLGLRNIHLCRHFLDALHSLPALVAKDLAHVGFLGQLRVGLVSKQRVAYFGKHLHLQVVGSLLLLHLVGHRHHLEGDEVVQGADALEAPVVVALAVLVQVDQLLVLQLRHEFVK